MRLSPSLCQLLKEHFLKSSEKWLLDKVLKVGAMERMNEWITRTYRVGRDSVLEGKILKYFKGPTCIFCEMPEQSDYKPEGEFVCSKCSVRLVEMSQDELKQGIDYLKTKREKLCLFNFQAIDNKIKALEIFIREEHEQRKPIERNFNRERAFRPNRIEKINTGRFAAESRFTFL